MPSPIDTSIYTHAGPAPNPLGMISQFAQTQNALNQNALFQQTFRARQALGGIMQQAVDPNTGQIDYNKAAVLGSTNPATAFIMPEMINQWTQRALTQQQTVNEALKNAQMKYSAIGNAAAGLVAANQGSSKVPLGDVISATATLKGQGLITDEDQMNFLTSLGKDDGSHYARLLQVAQQAQGAEKTLGGVFQQVTTPAGGYTQQGTANVYGGTYSPMQGGKIEHSPGPEAFNAPQKVVNPLTGSETTAPRAAVLPMYGGLGSQVSSPNALTSQGWNAGLPPISGSPQGQGAQGSVAPGGVGGSAQVPGPANANVGVTSALSPYQSDALKQIATKYEPDLNSRVQQANQLLVTMAQVRDELKDFKPGGGMSQFADLARLAQAVGMPQSTVDQLVSASQPGGLGSVQAAEKLFFGIGSQVAAQLIHNGGGRMTQTEWAQTLSRGSPNIDMDPRAIQSIFNATKELAHYTKLESNYFQAKKSQADAGSYNLTHAPNDWQNVLGELIARRSSFNRGETPNAPAQPGASPQ